MIRSGEQFLAMFSRLGRQGGTLQIATGAEIDLPTIVIEGNGRYRILAEPGARRPLLRFRPSPAAQRSPADWTVMLSLRSGSLQLEGVDLVVPDAEMLQTERLAAVGLVPGTELELDDCTLTLAINRPGSALFVVGPQVAAANPQTSGSASVASAAIRVRDSFLRSGGDGISVAAGRRLELELGNVLVGTEASLVHAFAGARPGRADAPAVKIRMDQVTARVKGGLIHLESTPLEPELPFTAVTAENSILSTANRDDPLFRLDGRNQLDDLGDKIQWEGRKVAYDRIKTYRRDEVARTGVSPRIYDRANWTSAFLPRDESPFVADVKFLRESDLAGAAWKLERDDLRLAPDSPVLDASPDLSRIPQPPSGNEL
jgi:serine/threonine-protein kinase